MTIEKHWMLDIETLGVGSNAVVTQIAMKHFATVAVEENIWMFGDGEAFNQFLSVAKQVKIGRKIEENTVKWWVDTNVTRFIEFFSFDKALLDSLLELSNLLHTGGGKTIVWARDPDFDCRILGNLFEHADLTTPWHFTDTRSHRTALALAGIKHTSTGEHDALGDVEAQIESLKKSLYILQKKD